MNKYFFDFQPNIPRKRSLIMEENIEENVMETFLARFYNYCEKEGIDFLIYGGYVRDFFNGDTSNDIDIAVFSCPFQGLSKHLRELGYSICDQSENSGRSELQKKWFLQQKDSQGFCVDISWLDSKEFFHTKPVDFQCNNLCAKCDSEGKFYGEDVEVIYDIGVGLYDGYIEQCIQDAEKSIITPIEKMTNRVRRIAMRGGDRLPQNKDHLLYFRRAWRLVSRGYKLSQEFLNFYRQELIPHSNPNCFCGRFWEHNDYWNYMGEICPWNIFYGITECCNKPSHITCLETRVRKGKCWDCEEDDNW